MLKLKYLFEAEYFDGQIYRQNAEDKSIKFPPIKDENGIWQGKSCMSDIQADVDNFLIRRFTLIEQSNLFKSHYSVFLNTGHFEINGKAFEVEGERPLPIENAKFKLIYFRVRRVHQNVTYQTKTGQILNRSRTFEDPVKFMIGWQCDINGKNYQQKILVK